MSQIQAAREQQKRVSDLARAHIAHYRGLEPSAIGNWTPIGPAFRNIIERLKLDLGRHPVYDDDHQPSDKTTLAELVGMFTAPATDARS